MRLPQAVLVALVTLASTFWGVPSQTLAAPVRYIGGSTNNDWGTAANWDNGEPQANSSTEISNGATVSVTQSGERAKGLVVDGGSTLNIASGDLTYGNLPFVIGDGSPGAVNQLGGLLVNQGGNPDLIIGGLGVYNLTAGTMDLADDLILQPGSALTITSAATLSVGDDLQFSGDAASPAATVTFLLMGDAMPMIEVGGDLILDGNSHLAIRTDHWTGSFDGPLQIFQASNVVGEFTSVTVDGAPLTAGRYGASGGMFSVNVPEPVTACRIVLALFCLVGLKQQTPRS